MAVETLGKQPAVARRARHVTPAELLGTAGRYVLLAGLAATFLLPFYWMASSAMKDDSQVYTVPPVWIPNPAYIGNFWTGELLKVDLGDGSIAARTETGQQESVSGIVQFP